MRVVAHPTAGEESPPPLTRRHLTRLRQIHRSSGWPCHDGVEVELIVAGLVESVRDSQDRETLRLTPAGLERLAGSLSANRSARDAHEALVDEVARWMLREKRIVWKGLSLRARVKPDVLAIPADSDAEAADPQPVSSTWKWAMPDVFSVRQTSVEAYLGPIVHEIKVSRADLLGDLKRLEKRGAYLAMSQQVYYVLGNKANGQPIAQPDEIPRECGVMWCASGRLEVARMAPRRPFERLRFDVWMALAKAAPVRRDELLLLEDGWMDEEVDASTNPTAKQGEQATEAEAGDGFDASRSSRIKTLGTGQLWL